MGKRHAQFKTLRVLDVHFVLIFDHRSHASAAQRPKIIELLPHSLEALHIRYPKQRVIGFLGDLLGRATSVPHLVDVRLHCRADAILTDDEEIWGARFHELAVTMPFDPVWTQLWDLGIETVPVQDDGAFDPRWFSFGYAIITFNAIIAEEAEDRWKGWYPHGFPCPVVQRLNRKLWALKSLHRAAWSHPVIGP